MHIVKVVNLSYNLAKIIVCMNELRSKIEKILNESIRPRLELHGGGVEIEKLDLQDKKISLKFSGVCLGCPAADSTFNNLVKTELKEKVPELKDIVLIQ
ncbi:MAG: NifU family protein [Candidatus Magasanikbacteria bacterium]|nr:NifU family protein [Candidatus Magasanikbacteria bacterium]